MSDVDMHLSALRDELGANLTPARIGAWGSADDARMQFLAKRIVGTVEWDKVLGRPDSAALADGFAITHSYFDQTENMGPDGPHPTGWRSGDPPVVWDEEDRERYRVGYSCAVDQPGITANRVAVEMLEIRWRDGDPRFGGPRRVEPPIQEVDPPALRAVMTFEVVIPPHL
jgi:hypothetical protein